MRRHSKSFAIAVFVSIVTMAGLATSCDIANDVADSINIPIEFDTTTSFGIDIGQITGPTAGQPSPAAATFDVAAGALPIDLISQSSALAANREKVRRLEFTQITVTPKTNTLTSASPPLDLFVGPKGATMTSQGVKIATIPAIPPGSTTPVNATIDAAGMDAAQANILQFDFVVIPAGTLSVAQGETVPDGALDMDLTLAVKATLNPTK